MEKLILTNIEAGDGSFDSSPPGARTR